MVQKSTITPPAGSLIVVRGPPPLPTGTCTRRGPEASTGRDTFGSFGPVAGPTQSPSRLRRDRPVTRAISSRVFLVATSSASLPGILAIGPYDDAEDKWHPCQWWKSA
jgi:hypothetical protein